MAVGHLITDKNGKTLASFSRWREGKRRWVLDSGSAFGTISKNDVTVEESQTAKPINKPLQIITANGMLGADETCEI